jgi:hypothetical protein
MAYMSWHWREWRDYGAFFVLAGARAGRLALR